MQVALASGAAVFAICAIAVLHFVGWIALQRVFTPLISALVVLAIDIVLIAIFALIALKHGPNRVEREALQLRNEARRQLAVATETSSSLDPRRLVGRVALRALPRR